MGIVKINKPTILRLIYYEGYALGGRHEDKYCSIWGS